MSSMSRKGDCWDNAVAESFFGTLKTELVHGAGYTTRVQAKSDIVDYYIEMFLQQPTASLLSGIHEPNGLGKAGSFTKSCLTKCPLLLD